MGRGRPTTAGIIFLAYLFALNFCHAALVEKRETYSERASLASESTQAAHARPHDFETLDIWSKGVPTAPTGSPPSFGRAPLRQHPCDQSQIAVGIRNGAMAMHMRMYQQGYGKLLFFLWGSLEFGYLQPPTTELEWPTSLDASTKFTSKETGGGKTPGKAAAAKGPNTSEAPPASSTAPLSQQLLQALPATPKAVQPAAPAAPASDGGERIPSAMAELMAALTQQREALPPSVQALLENHVAEDYRTAAKSMHRLVKQQSQARQELSNLRRARAQYTSEWNEYLSGLKDLLAKQLEIKNLSMKEFAESESKWTAQLNSATKALQQANVGAPKGDVTDLTLDEETAEDMEAEVSRDAEQEARRSVAVEQATDKEHALVEALRSAQQAAEAQAEQYRERTPRRSRPQAGEVAIQDYVSDAMVNPFADVDKRMSPGSSLWEGACQDRALPTKSVLSKKADTKAHYNASVRALSRLAARLDPQVQFTSRCPSLSPPPLHPVSETRQVRSRGPHWSLLDCIADAVSSAGTRTRAVQLIRHPLHGLPEPQIVLTPASAPPHATALPIDLRSFGFSVYTVEAEPEQSAADIVTALQTTRTGRRGLLDNGLEPNTLDFLDSQGRTTTMLQDPVSVHEWVKLVDRVQQTSTTTTTTPFDQSLYQRPVRVPGILERAEILPSGVLVAPGAHMPISGLGLFQLVVRGPERCTPFLLLVRGCVPVRLDGAHTWTLLDFCASAASNAECIPRRVQVLTSPLPDLLQPQIVVTDQAADPACTLVPIDLRAAPCGDIVPVLLRQGMSTPEVIAAIIAEIPDSRAFLDEAMSGRGIYFQDAEGFIWDELPPHLSTLQWLVLRRGSAPPACVPRVPTSTTTTLPVQMWCGPPQPALTEAPPLCVAADVPSLPGSHLEGRCVALQAPSQTSPLTHALLHGAGWSSCHAKECMQHQVSLVEVKAGSRPPALMSPIDVPPEGPPPHPDRETRTPPASARGPSSSRPSNADLLRAAQIKVLPPEVAEAAVLTAPVGAFSWTSNDQGVHTGAFSVFDARRHHTADRAHQYATLQEIVALAIAHAPFQVIAVQVLTHTLRGLPTPQLVLQEAGRPPHEFPLVWDLRGIQEPVLTCRHLPRELRDDALNKLQRMPGFLRDLKAELAQGAIALFDSLGSLPDQLPSNLQVVQHVRATAFTGPGAPASTHTGPARQTGIIEVAGRGNRPRIGPARQHPPGLRITVLRGQHRFSVDCTFDNGAIDALVFDLLLQHHAQASLPPSFSIVLGGAQPLRMGYFQEVAFVVQEGNQVATIWDGRHLGQELQVNLHPQGQSTCQVLDGTWTGNGWRLFVNGVPEAAAMRHIRFGDYLQPCSGTQCPGVVPLGSLLALCPALRPYAWPLEVAFTGTGFSALLRRRRKQLGSHRMPEGTARIYGPHHGEIFLQLGTGHTPTALQVDTALQGLDGFPDGLSVLGTPTRHPHDADFVTRYRYRQDSTVLTPAPGHGNHLLVLLVHPDIETLPGVPANPRIMLYPQRGLRHGDVLQQIPEPHFVFGEESEEEPAASDPAGPPPPEPLGSGGTSLACVPPRPAPRKQIIFDRPRTADTHVNNPGRKMSYPAGPSLSIATPMGRRSLPPTAAAFQQQSLLKAHPNAQDNAAPTPPATTLCLAELVGATPEQPVNSSDWSLRFQVPEDMPHFAFDSQYGCASAYEGELFAQFVAYATIAEDAQATNLLTPLRVMPLGILIALLTGFGFAHPGCLVSLADLGINTRGPIWMPGLLPPLFFGKNKGTRVCLDYLLYPADWSPHAQARTGLPLLDVHAGIDHDPIGLQLDVPLCPPVRRNLHVDRNAMMSGAGQNKIQVLLSAMPAFPWHMDVDDHLLLLQAQIRHSMQAMFPRDKQGPRKPTVSPDTWALLRLRRHHRRINRRKTQAYHRWLLYQCFRAWGKATAPGHVAARLVTSVKNRDYAAATHMHTMRVLSRRMRQESKEDEANFSRQAIQDARARGPAALAHSIRAVLKHGRRYKPAAAAPMLERNGQMISEPSRVKLELGRQFAKAEQATEGLFSQMTSVSHVCPGAPILVQDLPTLAALASAFASLKCGKASGLSQIPTELYKAAPFESAMLYMPVLLKACARGTWPALWRGVEAIGLLKPNKPPTQPSSFRSIALLDNSGKAATKACRRVLSEKLETVVLPSMGGAREGIPLELAALTVQGHLEMLQSTRSAGAVLFIDGISAFYATDRQLLFPRTSEALRAHLSSLPIEQTVADRFFTKAGCEGALSRAGVSTDLIHLLNTTYVGTWYTTDPTSATAFSTSCGTLPGAPLADIGFQYVILAALEALQEHMIAEDLQVQIPLIGAEPSNALPVSWLDDLAILLQCEAISLVGQIARTASLVQQYLRIAGVEVNFAPGKSEILIHWAGPHSKRIREQIMITDRARIRVPDFAGRTQHIHCVSRYVHLGSLRDHKADLQEEIQRRATLTREAYHPVRKRLLANPCFTRAERQGMFVSFILSRFLHGAGTWVFGDATSQAAFIRRYMSFARGAVRPLWGVPCRRLTESQVCSLVNCLTPLEAMACARLRTLAQVAGRGTEFLRVLVAKATLWIDETMQDVEHVAKVLRDEQLRSFVNTRSSTPEWLSTFPYSPEHARGLIRRYRNARLKLRADHVDNAVRKASTLEKADEAGLRIVYWPEPAHTVGLHTCAHCQATFDTAAARAAHLAKVHAQAAPAAAAIGSACQACMKEFWSTQRLREHLRKSRRCVQSYNGADLGHEAPVKASTGTVVLPPTVLIGPRPFWASLTPPLPSFELPTPGALEQILATANHSGKDFYHSFLKTRARLVENYDRQVVTEALATASVQDSSWLLAASLPFPEDLQDGEYRAQSGKTVILARKSAILLGSSDVIQRLAGEVFDVL
ncbi:unnamed protein product [Symbiodinium microadriaticum]|nr:unnamed protein product [Symbiodinium microadriaticum]CAE7943286.1 unnamed protein product [Symbiodinium sp. KB8]